MTRLRRSRRALWLSGALAAAAGLGLVAMRPLLNGIAESARRPAGRMGRLLYGPAPAGLAPYRRILDALDYSMPAGDPLGRPLGFTFSFTCS